VDIFEKLVERVNGSSQMTVKDPTNDELRVLFSYIHSINKIQDIK